MDYTYLLINFFTIVIPFAFSFHPKLKFYKTWNAFLPAVLITGIIFIAWDAWFTRLGVWGFNMRYVTGIEVAGLPVEEVLFFLCIPYACVFTYHCFSIFLPDKVNNYRHNLITILFITFLLIIGSLFNENIYTIITFFSLAALLAISAWFFKVNWLTKFYLIYAILLIPFLIVNGLLTGTGLEQPVVWYNEAEIIGWRLLTIPFEDIFYGMELILLNVLIYEYLKKKINIKIEQL